MAIEYKLGNNVYSFWFYPITWKCEYKTKIYIRKYNCGPIREEWINYTIYFGIKNNKIDWNSFCHEFYPAMEPDFVRFVEKYVKNYVFS